MGLDVPDLDDRTYEELLADARKRLPVHAEEWTDHNAHDPGITILELLAFLAETHTFQLDQVDDAHRRKYLELVDVAPRPPQAATVALSLAREPADPSTSSDGDSARADGGTATAGLDGTTVPAGSEVVAETTTGRRAEFLTTESVDFSDTRVAAVLGEHGGARADHTRANEVEGLHFRPFGEDPAPGDAMYVGFEGDPFASPTLDLWVDFHEANLPAPASHADESVDFQPSTRCVWEHCVTPSEWFYDTSWKRVRTTRDETTDLYRGGPLTLERPDSWHTQPMAILDHDDKRHWLRCRLAAREGEGGPEPRYEVPPQVNAIDVNVTRARHGTRVGPVELQMPSGHDRTTSEPNQVFDLPAAPVRDVNVWVGGDPWDPVADFDESSGDDTHVVLDEASGQLTFGDGRRGKIPEPWESVEASFEAGGGPDGNLPADADWELVGAEYADVAATPTAPPSGGREAESIGAALSRAREQRRVPHRAVTAEDHAYVATHTPGLRFGRAAVASAPGGGAPVTVVVVPYSPEGRLPVPSAGFRDAVESHLCGHALLTERVRVVGPTYVPVDVQLAVEPVAGADREAVRRAAGERIADFLDPLDGFEGDGWPFGRPVYHSELYEQIETMDRVADAVDVGVSTGGEAAPGDEGDELPDLRGVTVELVDGDGDCRRGT